MSELTKEQKLEAVIINLKARAFDMQEKYNAVAQQNELFVSALSAIASLTGVEGETVSMEALVKSVEALVPAQEVMDFDAK